MKKIVMVIVLFWTLYSAYSLDHRQVLFGNSYKNIREIDANNFLTHYPRIKEYTLGQKTYARVYEQIIGKDTFYRVLLSYEQFSDKDFLDWKNIYFRQFLFFKISTTVLVQIGNDAIFGSIDSNDTTEYTGFEIIERNNTVIGIMHYSSNNSASYSLWQNMENAPRLGGPTIFYASFNESSIKGINITANKSLVDSRRPFMYTIQNAFDGNPATSYVEDTDDDTFSFQFDFYDWDYSERQKCTAYKIINGYASGDYYYQNNQIAKVSVGYSYYEEEYFTFPHDNFQLYDTVQPQVMNFEAIDISPYMDLTMDVHDITNGTRYNDTAIAEFDLYVEGEGWVFGSSDTNTIRAPQSKDFYKYGIKSDETVVIRRYTGKETEVTIPSIIEYRGNTYTVTSISGGSFENSKLTSIIIPDTVTYIGDLAFENSSLTSIIIPNSVTSIGRGVFKDSKLTSVSIPDSVTSIGSGAFEGTKLTSIIIPDSVTSIGHSAFASTPLTSIIIPDGITSIESGIFYEAYKLTSITIPDSVTSIGDAAFMNSYNVTSITIPDSVTSIGDWAFYSCYSLTSMTIPRSVRSIGKGAFVYSKNLTLSVFPDTYALEYAIENDIPYIVID